VAASPLVVLALDRATFVNVLGPLQDLMAKEKSAEVCVRESSEVVGVEEGVVLHMVFNRRKQALLLLGR
jgi:hypothetical protein